MTTSVRLTHIGGNKLIRVTEHGAGRQVEGHSAIVAELKAKGDEHVIHVHADNKFEIEEFEGPPDNNDPRDPNPEAA